MIILHGRIMERSFFFKGTEKYAWTYDFIELYNNSLGYGLALGSGMGKRNIPRRLLDTAYSISI